MAQLDRNSNVIANAVASPKVINSPAVGGDGIMHEVCGLVAPAADDSANSIHRFVRVPSNARISQILFTSAIATVAGAINLGVYQTAENGGAVVDADLFASAQSLSAAALVNADVTYESGEFTAAESIMPLWQVLGLTSDPSREYDIAATISTTYNGAATAQLLKVRFVK